MFTSLQSNVISVLCLKDFKRDGGNGFGWVGRCRDHWAIAQFASKWVDFKTNTRGV